MLTINFTDFGARFTCSAIALLELPSITRNGHTYRAGASVWGRLYVASTANVSLFSPLSSQTDQVSIARSNGLAFHFIHCLVCFGVFAQEVRALANAHEKELEEAMAKEMEREAEPSAAAPPPKGGGAISGRYTCTSGERRTDGNGLEFWSRQSDLWSGVFSEQQTGLLQMVRAQEAELRQGKQRISSLEQELSALNDKRAEMAAAAAAAGAGTSHGNQSASGGGGGHRSLKEAEASDWRKRLERMQADYDRRLSVLQEREAAVVTAELRVESRARELGSERDRLTAGAVALSAEADGLRCGCDSAVLCHHGSKGTDSVASVGNFDADAGCAV